MKSIPGLLYSKDRIVVFAPKTSSRAKQDTVETMASIDAVHKLGIWDGKIIYLFIYLIIR
jgi:hypothetical protein